MKSLRKRRGRWSEVRASRWIVDLGKGNPRRIWRVAGGSLSDSLWCLWCLSEVVLLIIAWSRKLFHIVPSSLLPLDVFLCRFGAPASFEDCPCLRCVCTVRAQEPLITSLIQLAASPYTSVALRVELKIKVVFIRKFFESCQDFSRSVM